jgi:hypothetical protein
VRALVSERVDSKAPTIVGPVLLALRELDGHLQATVGPRPGVQTRLVRGRDRADDRQPEPDAPPAVAAIAAGAGASIETTKRLEQ